MGHMASLLQAANRVNGTTRWLEWESQLLHPHRIALSESLSFSEIVPLDAQWN